MSKVVAKKLVTSPVIPAVQVKHVCYCKKCGQTITSLSSKCTDEFYAHLNNGQRCYEFGQSVLSGKFSDADMFLYLIVPKQ